MNNKICLSTKSFICIVAFILTFNFSFAKSNSEKNINPIFNTQALKITTNPNLTNTAFALTLSYDVATFCAGTYGISKPNVNQAGGLFSYTKNANNNGYLIINLRTGMIDHYISDPGVYTITYKVGEATVSATITINKCNK
jgi:hypothetical protein